MPSFGRDSGNKNKTVPANVLTASRHTLTESGVVYSIEVFVDDSTPAGNIRLGIYDNSGNLKVDAGARTVIDGWNTITGLSVPLSPADYLLAILMSAGNNLDYQQNSEYTQWRTYTYGPLPDPFGTPTGNDTSGLVIRAWYTVPGADVGYLARRIGRKSNHLLIR